MKFARVPAPADRAYQEFLRSDNLSVGVYRLPVGGTDNQQPHQEDELYYVMAGRAKFTAGNNVVQLRPGDCLLVRAGEPHRFHDVVEALEVLVVFGPAEGSRCPGN